MRLGVSLSILVVAVAENAGWGSSSRRRRTSTTTMVMPAGISPSSTSIRLLSDKFRGGSDEYASELLELLPRRQSMAAALDTPGDSCLADLPPKVSEKAINSLVKHILKERDINIRLLPDAIEKKLYKMTVRMTLNAIYTNVAQLDGTPALKGYKLKLRHYPGTTGNTDTFNKATRNDVDVKQLEATVDHLLENSKINQPLIPDKLERQIYINCLKVVFRVLDIVQDSISVTFCGHSLGLYLKPSPNGSFKRATSNLSKLTQEEIEKLNEEGEITDSLSSSLAPRRKRNFLEQVQGTLNGLILHIIEDLFGSTAMEFVGIGKIVMDLVPADEEEDSNDEGTSWDKAAEVREQPPKAVTTTPSSSTVTPAVFLSGVGIGAAAVLLILNKDIEQFIGEFFHTCKNQVQHILISINQSLPKWKMGTADSKKEEETQS